MQNTNMTENDWYVAIMDSRCSEGEIRMLRATGVERPRRFYSFTAVGSKYYRNFKELSAPRSLLKIVAERFNVTDEEIGRVQDSVTRLVEKLNVGEELNPQIELEKIFSN